MATQPNKLIKLPIYGLTTEIDEEKLSKAAQDLAQLMEETGLYDPSGPVPAHTFEPARVKEAE